MLEMVQNLEKLDAEKVREGIRFVKENWVFKRPCDDSVIEKGVRYALAVGMKIEERGYEAVSLIDVDGMKKLLGFPPAMVFMLLEHYYGVQTIPENDIMGAATQLILKYLSGQTIPYLEYYEFFEDSMIAGVPDFVPKAATLGDVTVLPAAFGLLNASLLNVSQVKTATSPVRAWSIWAANTKCTSIPAVAKRPCPGTSLVGTTLRRSSPACASSPIPARWKRSPRTSAASMCWSPMATMPRRCATSARSWISNWSCKDKSAPESRRMAGFRRAFLPACHCAYIPRPK